MCSIFRPSTPPALLISSIANAVPLCEDCPNAASLPVKEANSPTLIVAPPLPLPPLASDGLLQLVTATPARTTSIKRSNADLTQMVIIFVCLTTTTISSSRCLLGLLDQASELFHAFQSLPWSLSLGNLRETLTP